MKIYVVDFEEVLKNYTSYHESLKKINAERKSFSDKIESIKSEMSTIISSSKSLFLDDNTQLKNANRFKELQSEAMKLESSFRVDITELQNSELEKNFKEVSDIVSEWAKAGQIDLVINKSQTIYVSGYYDVTQSVIDLLKENGVYSEFIEEELVES